MTWLRLWCSCLLFASGCLLVSCAMGHRAKDGTTYAFATGNAAWTDCTGEPILPKAMASMDAPPASITPVTKDGCVVVQGGSEMGTTLAVILGLLAGMLV